jgi:dUTP pyrophosphatase
MIAEDEVLNKWLDGAPTKPLIEIKLLHPDAKVPQYATPGSAGLDLSSVEDYIIEPYSTRLIQTGVAIRIADPGYVGILASRSGHALKHQVRLGNGIGVIDSDYQQEVGVILHNDSAYPFPVKKGERIAQLLIMPVQQVNLMVVDEFSTQTNRGGFGSTGQ